MQRPEAAGEAAAAGDRALLARAEAIPTTVLSDIARDHGHPHQALAPNIQALNVVARRTAGWAYTLAGGAPDGGVSGPDHLKARAIDGMPPDSIAVWAGGDVEGVCLFGDLLAVAMQVRGVRGAVVDGGVRDLDDIEAAGFPVHGRYRTPKASTGHWRVRAVQVPVLVRGPWGSSVTVTPGDLVVMDRNGVVVVPRSAAIDVVTASEAHQGQELEVRARIEGGESIEALLRRYGRI